jgi:dephospho-CoA kinase
MIKVGLTGNIGSGKSIIARIFSSLGIPVFNADDVSKSFLLRTEIKSELIFLFGEAILLKNGDIDRRKLAEIVFSDRASLVKLNNLLHPLVMNEFLTWSALHEEKPYVINESAIIFEYGFQDYFDKIIHVSCPVAIAISRVVLRDAVKDEDVLRRMQFQMNDKEKAALSDFSILNDGFQMVIPQVLEVHSQLLQRATNRYKNIPARSADTRCKLPVVFIKDILHPQRNV